MSYFKSTDLECVHYSQKWIQVLDQIKRWDKSSISAQISHPLEAKALYVFTIARHLTRTAYRLGKVNGWKPVFIETTILLFPMLELMGYSRLDDRQVSKYYNKKMM